jgi:hypothetical protein
MTKTFAPGDRVQYRLPMNHTWTTGLVLDVHQGAGTAAAYLVDYAPTGLWTSTVKAA